MKNSFAGLLLRPTLRETHILLLLASLAILTAVFITQYGFHYRPCEMCVWQRWPYAAVIALSSLALFRRNNAHALLALCALALGIGLGLAVYHTGVEHHIFTGPTACTDSINAAQNLDELRNLIKNAQVVQCDVPSLRWFGFSLAEWNVAASLALLAYALRTLRRQDHARI